MTIDPATPGSQGQAPGEQGTPGQAPTSTPQAGNEPQNNQLSLEALQQELAEARREAAKYRFERKKQEEAVQAAEQQRLAEQGQFKELAEKHEKRVQELEPKAAQLEALAAKLKQQILTATKDWPSQVKAFYPGDDADINQLQDWYERSQQLLALLQQQARGQQPGNQPNPRPANQAATQQEQMQANRDSFIRQRSYGL